MWSCTSRKLPESTIRYHFTCSADRPWGGRYPQPGDDVRDRRHPEIQASAGVPVVLPAGEVSQGIGREAVSEQEQQNWERAFKVGLS